MTLITSTRLLAILIGGIVSVPTSYSFFVNKRIRTAITAPATTTSFDNINAVHVQWNDFEEAWNIIDRVAKTGDLKSSSSTELDQAVRFLEVNSYKIYPVTRTTHEQQEQYQRQPQDELWKMSQGSWRLMASTGSGKTRHFHSPPWWLPFSFAMIDDNFFGNGIGFDAQHIGLAFLHHATFHPKHRQLTVTHPTLYLFGYAVALPDWLRPSVLKMVENNNNTTIDNLSTLQQEDHPSSRLNPLPTFVLVGASKHALIARGNQSGGLALWVRLPDDIRSVAYHHSYPTNVVRQVNNQDVSSVQDDIVPGLFHP